MKFTKSPLALARGQLVAVGIGMVAWRGQQHEKRLPATIFVGLCT
jgi:hypothetical protein